VLLNTIMGNECQSIREMSAIPDLNLPAASVDKDEVKEVEVPKLFIF
jgi:hypothetical protein